MAKKYEEDQLRFIGGFVLPTDTCNEHSVRRIYLKEAGGNSEIGDINYIASMPIQDWRFRGEEDKIMTTFFTCKYSFGPINPSDDIIELTWIDLSIMDDKWIEKNICVEHQPLARKLIEKLK